jgi:WD40 repeat protein
MLVFQAHQGAALRVVYSADARSLYTTGLDLTIRQWQATGYSGRLIGSRAPGTTSALAHLTAPDRLIAGGPSHGLAIWSVASASATPMSFRALQINDLCIDPAGQEVATANCDPHSDPHILLWSLRETRPPHRLWSHRLPINVLCYSPDGRWLVSGCQDGVVTIGDRRTPGPPRSLTLGMPIRGLCFAADTNLLVVASGSQLVQLDPMHWIRHRVVSGPTADIAALAADPTGRLLATGSRDGSVVVWDAQSLAVLSQFPTQIGWVWSVTFSPDGLTLAAAGSEGRVCIVDVDH